MDLVLEPLREIFHLKKVLGDLDISFQMHMKPLGSRNNIWTGSKVTLYILHPCGRWLNCKSGWCNPDDCLRSSRE